MKARIDRESLREYIKESGGSLWKIPIICTDRHSPYYFDVEVDADSGWCEKCGRVVKFVNDIV